MNRKFFIGAVCFFVFLLSLSTFAQNPTNTLPATDNKQVLLPKNTKVSLKSTFALKSGENKPGEVLNFVVSENVYGPNKEILIAQGATATGQVNISKGNGWFGAPGKLEIGINEVTAVDNSKVNIRCIYKSTGESDGVLSIVGGLFIWPLFILHGADVEIPVNYDFVAFVDSETMIKITP